MHSSVEDEVQL